MMTVLRVAGVPDLAARYSMLSERLIYHESGSTYPLAANLPGYTSELLSHHTSFDEVPSNQITYAMPANFVQDG